jgi:hypothetical protein
LSLKILFDIIITSVFTPTISPTSLSSIPCAYLLSFKNRFNLLSYFYSNLNALPLKLKELEIQKIIINYIIFCLHVIHKYSNKKITKDFLNEM